MLLTLTVLLIVAVRLAHPPSPPPPMVAPPVGGATLSGPPAPFPPSGSTGSTLRVSQWRDPFQYCMWHFRRCKRSWGGGETATSNAIAPSGLTRTSPGPCFGALPHLPLLKTTGRPRITCMKLMYPEVRNAPPEPG